MKDKLLIAGCIGCIGLAVVSTVVNVADYFRNKREDRLALERRLAYIEDRMTKNHSDIFINQMDLGDLRSRIKELEKSKN